MAEGHYFGRRGTGRARTVFATVLSGVLLIGLPLAGAAVGVWAASEVTTPKPAAETDEPQSERRCGMYGLMAGIEGMFLTVVTAILGVALGAGVGVVLAFQAVNTLSEWSVQG